MGDTLTPSGLWAPDVGDDWVSNMVTNFISLNNNLLKLSALLDVDDTGLADGDILKYNSSTEKWEPKTPSLNYSTTTTTTSTTTTT